VSGYCTCGAKLAEDARFCHKCGKPQREEDLQREQPPETIVAPVIFPPVLPAETKVPPIGFHNRPAVRAAMLAGMAGFLLSVISGRIEPALSSLGLVAAGFFAVYLYQRRTGYRLTVIHGAHLGWISGIFGFAITALVLAAVAIALSDASVVESMREQLQGAAASQQEQIEEMIKVVHNPQLMLAGVAVTFLLFTVFPAFGGALGAKLLDRRD
jgi:hypothetical protein